MEESWCQIRAARVLCCLDLRIVGGQLSQKQSRYHTPHQGCRLDPQGAPCNTGPTASRKIAAPCMTQLGGPNPLTGQTRRQRGAKWHKNKGPGTPPFLARALPRRCDTVHPHPPICTPRTVITPSAGLVGGLARHPVFSVPPARAKRSVSQGVYARSLSTYSEVADFFLALGLHNSIWFYACSSARDHAVVFGV